MNRPVLPSVNQSVEVTYAHRAYRTFVLDATPPRFVVAYPFPYDVRPEIGEEVGVGYVCGFEYGSFPARIDERLREPVLALVLTQLADVTFTWRRGAFRVAVSRPARLTVDEEVVVPAETIDVSATGALLRLKGELRGVAPETRLTVAIDLGPEEGFSSSARVVRIEEPQFLAVQFENLPSGRQDRLVRWLFAQQRELRRRGLL